MRKVIGRVLIAGILAVGAVAARAQDGAALAAMQASQQANDMSMQAAQTANQMAMQAAQANSMMMGPGLRPPLRMTPRPVIKLLNDGVSVALYDADSRAIMFYTVDGSLPTLRSQRYAGPIVMGAKMKIRAMAFDLEDMPSGVVSKTVRARS